MHDQEEGLANKPSPEKFMVSAQFDGFWWVDSHEYWARNCDLDMCLRPNHRLTKTFIACHSVELFALSPSHLPVVSVQLSRI